MTSDSVATLTEERYEIVRELGRGGMGAVYLARDVQLDRLVALKVLPAEFALQPALRQRFLRETRLAASFSHPNIVPVYAVEESETSLAFVMGFVEGDNLTERVRRGGPLTVREIVRMLQDVGYALAYAHGRGIVHRDIKPDNIMIERATGRALIMDFGIARAMSEESTTHGLTRVGEVIGTPEYMSPEQASGDAVDGRSDLYSLGLVAFFAATGQQAVTADTPRRMLVKQLTEMAPSVSSVRSDLPPALVAVIDRLVVKDPSERFATAEGLVEALDAAQLISPEIPLAIRLLERHLVRFDRVVLATLLLGAGFYVTRGYGKATETFAFWVCASVLWATVLVRVAMVRANLRLALQIGHTTDDIIRGLRALEKEPATAFSEFRSARARRWLRWYMIMLLVILAMSLALIASTPPHWVSPAPGTFILDVDDKHTFQLGLLLGCPSLAMLARLSLGVVDRRALNLIWLSRSGRWYLSRVSASVARRKVRASRLAPPGQVVPGDSKPAVRGDPDRHRMSRPDDRPVESRLAALEKWKDDMTARLSLLERDRR